MDQTTFIIWKWVGWRGSIYTADHVNAFSRMLSANLQHLPHNILCITDDPAGITECDTYPLWAEWPNLVVAPRKPNCFRRLRLFDAAFSQTLGSKLVSIDMDCVIRSDISHLFMEDVPFKITEGRHAKYLGSLWMLKPGAHQHVWNEFHPVNSPREIMHVRRQFRGSDKTKLIGSDQAWMSLKIPDAALWPVGTREEIISYRLDLQPGNIVPPQAKIVFFAGGVKPWDKECRDRTPGLYHTWMSYQNSL